MKRLDVSENTSISMPARNLLSIIGACLVGAWFGFGVIERLNNIETKLQLMEKDLEAANTFIDGVPKGDMVSPQVQELYMLVEYLSGNVEKLKEQVKEVENTNSGINPKVRQIFFQVNTAAHQCCTP